MTPEIERLGIYDYRVGSDWDHYFLEMVKLVASKSRDPSTKCGAVIVSQDHSVLSTGYNGFPRGVNYTEERLERPLKYEFIEHGERNAILNAARHGVALAGTKMYLNFRPECCTDCTKAVIQSGITEVIGPNIPFPGNKDKWKIGPNIEMMQEAGVILTVIEDNV